MALSPQLLQFKSSGVYRLEFDKSQTANINVETLRLVVGHSRKGPYNTPVLVSNIEEFTNVFGSIDRKLEKKGMFFHRSAAEALSRGPILALNLASLATAKADFVSPVTNGSDDTAALASGEKDYTDFFNTDKFLTPSDERVLAAANAGDDNLINFVNIKQNGITVVIRQAQEVKEFEITAREWFGEGNTPEYMHESDYISDYMVDVFVFKGEFDASVMTNDPVYGAYFDATGIKKDKLAEFANLRQVTLEAQYTGSLIPGFKDLEGRNLYVESMINAESRRTGLFCAIDEDAVLEGKADLVGHVYGEELDYEMLSYSIDNAESVTTTTTSYDATTVTLPMLGTDGANPITSAIVGNDLTFVNFDPATDFVVGEFLQDAAGTGYVEITAVNGLVVTTDAPMNAVYAVDTTAADVDVETFEEVTTTTTTQTPGTASRHAELAAGWSSTENGSMFELTGVTEMTMQVGDYVAAAEAGRLAKIKRIGKTGASDYKVYCDVNVAAFSGTFIMSYERAVSNYKAFTFAAATIPAQTISNCLSAVSGTGLAAGLIDKDLIDFRYVVDTFSSYDTNGLLNKSQLSELAKLRQNASAILNAPTVADFKNSTDPSFTDADGQFRAQYIGTGGNLDKNPETPFALPGIPAGANYAFYYGPGLIVSDNGKDIIVPPAAYVSNLYIDKYTTATPWSIVAGPRRGVVNGNGVKGAEYAFDKADRDVLEPFGINPIVFQRGVGLTILGNKTAQQSVKSALSSAHVREALIYIQDGIADILKGYVFEFNNTQTRLEIKTLADSFMEGVKADGGVYEFKNVMDQTNNTDDVIDQNFGIIDTYIEPVKGLEIVVHRTTVLNTGEIQSGNFN